MTDSAEPQWQEWIDTWQADAEPLPPPEAIRQHVQRRSRLLAIWVAGEAALAIGFSIFLAYRAITQSDPIEKLAMASLALIAASALVFSWWTWRGTWRASAQTTAAFVAVAQRRSHRLRRAIIAGWAILLGELLVFVPWIWHRLYGGLEPPTPQAERFGWGLLAGLSAAAVLFLIGFHAWVRRDARQLQNLIRELESTLPDSCADRDGL